MFDVEEIKEQIDTAEYIVDILGDMKRRGKSYVGLCPFHGEKTPSFHVYTESFHCFGCGATGDVVTFVMQYYEMDFLNAVQKLCLDNGIVLEADNKRYIGGKLKTKEYHRFGFAGAKMRKMSIDMPAKHDQVLMNREKELQQQLLIAKSHPTFLDVARELQIEYRTLLKKGLS